MEIIVSLADEAIITKKGNFIVQAEGDYHILSADRNYISVIAPNMLDKYTEGGVQVTFKKRLQFYIATRWKYMFCVSNVDETEFDWAGFNDNKGVITLENNHFFCRYNCGILEFCKYTTYTNAFETVETDHSAYCVDGPFKLKTDPYTNLCDDYITDFIEKVEPELVIYDPIIKRRRANKKKRKYMNGFFSVKVSISSNNLIIWRKAINGLL